MSRLDLFWIQMNAERVGCRCIYLYLWSPGACQWAQRHESLDGEWQWYFW